MTVLASAIVLGQATESSIVKQINGIRNVPDDKRPAVTTQIAYDIRTLPPGPNKLKLADAITHRVTEGDPGPATLQAVADALAEAIRQAPPSPGQDGELAMPYMDLAKLVRYEGATTDLKDPQYDVAMQRLAANDADIAKADFTLGDLSHKKYTLSQLRGKIVLVNFWATWCPPCQKEMQDLDLIYTRYQNQGLVILSISDENESTIVNFLRQRGQYHPPILLDPGDKIAKEFHIDGLPHSFVFDREGKLVAEAIDMRTQRQFVGMLAKAGLQP
jgi:thiol-disulfide isomerase/thioredoxin